MQDTDDVIELAVVDGQARVRRLAQLIEQILPAVLDIDTGNLLTRHHDVVHGELLQIEDRKQHLAMPGRDHGTRLGDHGAQLLGAQVLTVARGLHHAEDPQHAVGKLVRDPQQRPRQHHERAVDACRVQRDRFGVGRGVDFRRQLAKDDHDHGERRARRGHGVGIAHSLRQERRDG